MTSTANQPANPALDQGANPTANPLTVTRAKYDQLRAMRYAGRVADLDPTPYRQWLSERAAHWILTNDRGAASLMPVAIWDDMAAVDRRPAAAAIATTLEPATAALLAATVGNRFVDADRPWATGELCRELVRCGAVVVEHGEHRLTDLGAAVRDVLRTGVRLEALCGRCGEAFIPADVNDLDHAERSDGVPCGGLGELLGAWVRGS